MDKPAHCRLWTHPEIVTNGISKNFELIETYAEESHWSRRLLKCRECGQLYFYEFNEEVDWESGDDPQCTTLIPVKTEEEIEALKGASPLQLASFLPRLQKDWPKGAKAPILRWIGKE
jgi:hypothetical protein